MAHLSYSGRGMRPAPGPRWDGARQRGRPMSQTARYQETLRRLAMIDEGFVGDEAGLGLDLARTSTLEPRTAALVQLGVLIAAGALAAGATDDEIAGVLLAIAPVTGLGRVVGAAPDVATALGYDVGAALEELDDH